MKIGKWKILDSKYIIKRPWLTARVDKVELPSGVVHPEYYILEYPTWIILRAQIKGHLESVTGGGVV